MNQIHDEKARLNQFHLGKSTHQLPYDIRSSPYHIKSCHHGARVRKKANGLHTRQSLGDPNDELFMTQVKKNANKLTTNKTKKNSKP